MARTALTYLARPNVASLGYALFLAINAAGVWGGVFPFLPHDGQAEQRHEDQGDEKRGHRLGDSVEPEVHDGAVHRASDEVEVSAVGVRACEQALPQHVEAGRPESQKRTTNDDEREGSSMFPSRLLY